MVNTQTDSWLPAGGLLVWEKPRLQQTSPSPPQYSQEADCSPAVSSCLLYSRWDRTIASTVKDLTASHLHWLPVAAVSCCPGCSGPSPVLQLRSWLLLVLALFGRKKEMVWTMDGNCGVRLGDSLAFWGVSQDFELVGPGIEQWPLL